MNLPNRLTVSRFVLTAFFLGAMFWPGRFNDTVALVLFSLAGLTDFYDGRLARKHKLITNFGVLMDPLADKILICSAFIAFVERAHWQEGSPVKVEAWMVVVIVARELAITGLRLLAASKNVVLAAERYGKHKTISQVVAIISLLVLESYPEWGSWSKAVFQWWVPTVARLSLAVTIVLTLVSGFLYLWRNRRLYLDDM